MRKDRISKGGAPNRSKRPSSASKTAGRGGQRKSARPFSDKRSSVPGGKGGRRPFNPSGMPPRERSGGFSERREERSNEFSEKREMPDRNKSGRKTYNSDDKRKRYSEKNSTSGRGSYPVNKKEERRGGPTEGREKKSFDRDKPRSNFSGKKPFSARRSAGGDTDQRSKDRPGRVDRPYNSQERRKSSGENSSFGKLPRSEGEKRPRLSDRNESKSVGSGRDRNERESRFNKESSEKPARWNRKEDHRFYGERRKSKPNLPKTHDDGSVRLNKFISNAGICSRREADEMIAAGVISVNGEVVTQMGYKVMPEDIVKYNNESLRSERLVYILLNKPKDFITTTDDPEDRKTVMSLIAKACKERVYPVGRLDRNTTGVLLFTNDGDLAKKLTHPSFEVHKVYQVELDSALKPADMQQVEEGLNLADGFIKPDDVVYASADKKVIGVEIHSGKNRIVRRIFEHLGYAIKKLDRVVFAGLTKKDLPRGRWRFLSEIEIANLKMITGKGPKIKN